MVKATKKIKSAWTKLTLEELNNEIDKNYGLPYTVARRKMFNRLRKSISKQQALIKLIT